MKMDERRAHACRSGAELVQHARIGREANLPPGDPKPPAQVALLEVGEEVRIEEADLVESAAPDEQRSSLCREDLVGCREPILPLERAAMDQKAGRGEERAGGIEPARVVHQEELRLAGCPAWLATQVVDQGRQGTLLECRVVVQEQDQLTGRGLDSLVA